MRSSSRSDEFVDASGSADDPHAADSRVALPAEDDSLKSGAVESVRDVDCSGRAYWPGWQGCRPGGVAGCSIPLPTYPGRAAGRLSAERAVCLHRAASQQSGPCTTNDGWLGLDGRLRRHISRHRQRECPASGEHSRVASPNPHSPLSPSNAGPPINPVLVRHAEQRAQNLQARVADAITKFAGSMPFVYVHILWFVLWIGFRIEKFPFGLLTMIVSLEAIFLSTFVMISQNRADEKRQVLADQQWQMVQEEDQQNVQLLTISKQILELTTAIHGKTVEDPKQNN